MHDEQEFIELSSCEDPNEDRVRQTALVTNNQADARPTYSRECYQRVREISGRFFRTSRRHPIEAQQILAEVVKDLIA